MTGLLLDTTNVPRSTSIQRKSLPTCTLSLASVSAHTGKHRMAVDLPHVQANVVPFPSVAGGGGTHALLRSSPTPVRPRPRISTSVTSPSIRRKRSASRITSPSSSVSPPTTPTTPPRKRARTTGVSKSILKPATTPAAPPPRRAPTAEIKLNACIYHTIFALGMKRHAGKRRLASTTPRCTSPTPGSSSPGFDDSDDSDLDSEIEEELETAVHHALLEEQDIKLSLKLRCFLLKNGIDPRGVVFQVEREEEMDPFLKDEDDRMDVEVESGIPSVPPSSPCTPVALRNAPLPPSSAPLPRVHFPSDLPPRTMSTSPPRPSSSTHRPSTPTKAPPLPPPSHLTAILLLRNAGKQRQRYRSILARCPSSLDGTGLGLARGRKSPLRGVFLRAEVEWEKEEGGWEEGSEGSVLEDVLMAMMVEDEGMDVDLD
ncbi:uncharacterized protein LACBIDRAFT_333759 [Laccaria bicolor S238N-H82]|uniref:Predicted protein n=1 Tax=Laccaria bicolor (strain S238N-H82 / ATCC MYA-4686) TaxID=486041 RepID=B0DWZ5_LACBS|nr:uncharacterized protein LACBIDRAFT_333759 [Laccaria bicolor S238N-H82]EDR00898.1 predicted protein [Laccaria bicolor S238N-H82]|eukprot:XP_001888492.1 predicted protein [Laccaria bicolor S238N-H82]